MRPSSGSGLDFFLPSPAWSPSAETPRIQDRPPRLPRLNTIPAPLPHLMLRESPQLRPHRVPPEREVPANCNARPLPGHYVDALINLIVKLHQPSGQPTRRHQARRARAGRQHLLTNDLRYNILLLTSTIPLMCIPPAWHACGTDALPLARLGPRVCNNEFKYEFFWDKPGS